MYISDGGNWRIIQWASGSTSGVCIAACTGSAGTTLTQLSEPQSLAFDSNGLLYVSNWTHSTTQKFEILYFTDKFSFTYNYIYE
jgi:hypothetical protein